MCRAPELAQIFVVLACPQGVCARQSGKAAAGSADSTWFVGKHRTVRKQPRRVNVKG